MKKRGKLRAFRNLASGWVTHANHGRDKAEMQFHWFVELMLLTVANGILFAFGCRNWVWYAIASVAVHTVWWIVNGNFHVYMLDSFRFVRNAGIDEELKYILWAAKFFDRPDVRAVLVYGSFCRREFHGRSDLDLRIIRDCRKNPFGLFTAAVYARVVSMVRGCPTDLQIVDSEEFLQKQMSAREVPVDAFGGANLQKIKTSMAISEVCANPSVVMKPEREFEGW